MQTVISFRPSLLHLGDLGALVVCRFMSHPTGFEYLSSTKYMKKELDRWWDFANERYVSRTEELLNLSLTSFEKLSQTDGFVRRSGIKKEISPVPLPPHIYGELCKHENGCDIIKRENIIPKLIDNLKKALKNHEKNFTPHADAKVDYTSYKALSECLIKIKSCLWALAHIGSSSIGLGLLQPYHVLKMLTDVAKQSSVYSLRGTSFYCLSIISQTVTGIEQLKRFGWLSFSRIHNSQSDSIPTPVDSSAAKCSWSDDEQIDYSPRCDQLLKALMPLPPPSSLASCSHKDTDEMEKYLAVLSSNFQKQHLGQIKKISVYTSAKMKTSNTRMMGGKKIIHSDSEIDIVYGEKHGNDKARRNSCGNYSFIGKMTKKKLPMEFNKKQDVCCNKLMGVSALHILNKRLCGWKMSMTSYALDEERSENWSVAQLSNTVCDEIKQRTHFPGIVLPEDLDVFFKNTRSSSDPLTPLVITPARIWPKFYSHKRRSKSALAVAHEEPHTTANVRSSTSNFLDEVTTIENSSDIIHQEVIKLTMNLGSSVGIKMNETALLLIKERSPHLFDSVSLYHKISENLSHYSFRITARRFIQELFHDIPFTELYKDAKRVLKKHHDIYS